MKAQQDKGEKFQNLIIEENKNLNQLVNEKSSIIVSKDKEIRSLQQALNSKNREMTEQSLSLEDTLSIKQNNEALQGELAKSQEHRK